MDHSSTASGTVRRAGWRSRRVVLPAGAGEAGLARAARPQAAVSGMAPASTQDATPAPDLTDAERIDTTASADQMRIAAVAAPLPDLPLIVIAHGRPWSWPAGYPADDLAALWLPLQRRLAALIPDARLMVASDSDYDIPGEQPGLIIDAVRQVVAAVRDPSTWAMPQATPGTSQLALVA